MQVYWQKRSESLAPHKAVHDLLSQLQSWAVCQANNLTHIGSQAEGCLPLQAKKDPTLRTLEARLRNARYLGELAKFRLAPFGTIFVMLKVWTSKHTGQNKLRFCLCKQQHLSHLLMALSATLPCDIQGHLCTEMRLCLSCPVDFAVSAG